MELPTLEAFGRIDHNLVILSSDEYAFIAGSFIIVKQFKSTGMRSYRYLKSQTSHFTAMDFNPTRGILATCEGGRNATIRLFRYSDKDGFGESPQRNNIYKSLAEVSISKALEVSHLTISQDGSRLVCLLPAPVMQMKVYEINEQYSLNLLLTVPLERNYTNLKISPTKKDFIFLMSSEMATMVEVKDSFKDKYQSQFSDDKDITLIKKTEEVELDKRFVMSHLNVPNFIDNFVDCCWDMYDNVYLALTSGEVNLYDSAFNRITHTVQGELKEAIKLNRCPTALCLTQRYLVCFQDNGKIALANLWIPENVLPSFKTSLSSPENYRALEVAMEVTPSIYNSVLHETRDETVRLMKYDPEMKKIVAVTNCSLQVFLLKAEILLKEKEKESEIDDKIIGNSNEVESYEEMKFHSGKIIGVKELGPTSQFVTIGDDQKIIIWELSSRSALFSFDFDFTPTSFETDIEGNLIFIGSAEGVLRVYDISIRNILKLVYIMKWGEDEQHHSIDKIVVHPLMKYIVFFTREHNILYFLSGDLSKEFLFLGYVKAPGGILDASVNQDSSNGDITVLIKNFLISFKISEFKHDHNKVLEIKPKKTENLFSNFEISSEMKLRKVDGDLKYMIKNPISDSLWLSGSEKYLRMYAMPQESLETIKKNSKSPTENPIKDFKAHDLEVMGGCLYGNSLLTFGMDGTIQVRREDKEKFEKFSRTHSFIGGGITSMYYSPNKGLIYTSGYDGSIVITAFGEHEEIPNDATLNEGTVEELESLNMLDNMADRLVQAFHQLITDEHTALIRKTKKNSQLSYKEKLEDIKSELNKLLRENSKLEEIEQLPKNEIIVDFARIDMEVKEGVRNVNSKEKEYYRELCERQLKKNLLFENTYDCMRVKDEHSGKFNLNNNIRMVSSSSGEKILQTYPIRKISSKETERLNFVKQLRLMEMHSKYKRRNENLKEVIDETIFTNGNESYLVNRLPGRIILTEDEIRAQDVADTNAQDGMDKIGNESGQFKTAKYKLQRHPYADEINYGAKQEENPDAVTYKPDEQLLKEDLAFRYKTTIEQNKGNSDLEFSRNLGDIDCSNLLYSPFELYTNFRMRNQIYLISVIIQNLKLSFNKEFKVFITDRNACLEKFNVNKAAIDVIKESLLNLGSELLLDEYHYAINPHEDNEWVEKVEEGDIKTPKYFSREEKLRQEQEKRQEEERLKALQGDTLEMRGLKNMIEHKSLLSKQSESEEKEVMREAWMDKATNDMTQGEVKRYTDYMRKEKELLDQKEKLKSQNVTKLNSHKMEIDTIKTDMDSKFLKFLKKKMYYDYRIAEQELIIMALSRTMEYRGEIKLLLNQYKGEMEAVGTEESKMKEKLDDFEEGTNKFEDMFRRFLTVYGDKNKNNKLVELDKNLPENPENVEVRDEQLQNTRSDPLYFFLKDKFKKERKYGNKAYNEINMNNTKFTGNQNQRLLHEENLNLINQKYYYDYKNEQIVTYKSHLENEHEKIILNKEEVESRFKKYNEDVSKSSLNYDISIRIKKGQEEISGPNGPQEFIDECILLDNHKIDSLNRKIDSIYGVLKTNDDEEKDHNEILQFLDIDNTKTLLTKHEIELKLRYLKLTRVTKKIQEIVTGRDDIDPHQISQIYEQKKKKLEENKSKRIERMNDKLKDLNSEIDKKKKENLEFVDKFEKLVVEVKSKEQIINLDNDEKGGSSNQNTKTKSKSLEIAQVTKLKNLVQQYYEEIEYLRSELDKLRARTFPSFLQKPDQIIYPDDK